MAERAVWITRPLSANFGTDAEYAAALASADAESEGRRRAAAGQRREPHRRPPPDLLLRSSESLPSSRERGEALEVWCLHCCRWRPAHAVVCAECLHGATPLPPSTGRVRLRANTLPAIRESNSWTQRQLGRLWGVTPQMVSQVERGLVRTSVWNVRQLCRVGEWGLLPTLRALGVREWRESPRGRAHAI